ncbi:MULTISPECIES: hypothetical protein [Actinomadura]|uniref:Core-binding (CB) domain-containing protein n=1 Tax=Actinomadura yumaensis TaxID=111807 RepID=A0ABW2CL45_9ACTN
MQSYHYSISKHVMPEFGAMRRMDILPEHVRAWISSMKKNGISAATIRYHKVVLSAIFTTALNDQVTYVHSCKGDRTPVPEKPLEIISSEQFDALYHGLPGTHSKFVLRGPVSRLPASGTVDQPPRQHAVPVCDLLREAPVRKLGRAGRRRAGQELACGRGRRRARCAFPHSLWQAGTRALHREAPSRASSDHRKCDGSCGDSESGNSDPVTPASLLCAQRRDRRRPVG